MNNNKGITLIALVITIIVLLILAGVTIATLTGDNGLLQKAQNAQQANEEASNLEKIQVEVAGSYGLDGKIDKEQLNKNLSKISGLTYMQKAINLNDSSTKINTFPATVQLDGYAYIISENGSVDKVVWIDNNNGSYTNAETGQVLTVGDTVNYETILNLNAVDNTKLNQLRTDLATYSGDSSSTENSSIERDNLSWKVLDVKDGTIRLISATPTSKTIKLYGYNGYNNGVYLIDEACSILYASDKGIAKNLKIEDIEEKIDKTKFDYTQYVNTKVTPNVKYNETREYTDSAHLKYPNIYSSEIGCKAVSIEDNTQNLLKLSNQIDWTEGVSIANNRLKITQTYWDKSMASTDFSNSKYYTLFINNNNVKFSTYWLSSRAVTCGITNAIFGMDYVNGKEMYNYGLYYSDNGQHNYSYGFRPVITLNSNVSLTGNSTNGWTIQ